MSTAIQYPFSKPEIWGGIECTINRVGDQYRDQLAESNHYLREQDLENIVALGITRLRYPVLWEYHQPEKDTEIDWAWTEKQLNSLRNHGVAPIAGLLHHGSGPAYTSLMDPGFPELLAAYAIQVATKFPWLEYYTPVNEPLTTARFSSLYGIWYPHQKDEKCFIRSLLQQLKATVLSMEAIRKINPSAKLVQTEDLAKIHSSETLRYQAEYENERCWLTYDILCGKLKPGHYFWERFLSMGIEQSELEFFQDHPCVPDIIGFNYYVTSERFLDDQVGNYPHHLHGGNGVHSYVDVEAVRVNKAVGLPALLSEAWERYHLPVAITECHLSCTREEQLRWLNEIWEQCCQLAADGVNVKAVTSWALLGSYDWDSLLTCTKRNYEPGAFDISAEKLRPTAVAKMIRTLATGGSYQHPLLTEKGWWHNNDSKDNKISLAKTAPVLIIGKNGTLGRAFMRICERRSIPYIALSRNDLDISDPAAIQQAINTYRPWAIINGAGYVRVDDAELNSNECFATNTTGPILLANACREAGIRFMSFSSDLVFDGNKKEPYHENDQVNPLNVYGASKAQAESGALSAYPGALIIRTSAFFGPWDKYNFVYSVLESLKNDQEIRVPNDVIVSPTYVPDLVNTSLDLFIDEEEGIWHMSNEGMMAWSDFGNIIADRAGYKKGRIHSSPLHELGWKANRPLYSVLQSEKGIKLPSLEHALVRYFEDQVL